MYETYEAALARLAASDAAGAIPLLNEAISEIPNEPLFYEARARAFSEHRSFRKAEAELDAALRLAKEIESIYLAGARVRIAQGRIMEALDDLRCAVRLVRRAETYSLMGDAHERARDLPSALVSYRNAVALKGFDPDNPPLPLPANLPSYVRRSFEQLRILTGR